MRKGLKKLTPYLLFLAVFIMSIMPILADVGNTRGSSSYSHSSSDGGDTLFYLILLLIHHPVLGIIVIIFIIGWVKFKGVASTLIAVDEYVSNNKNSGMGSDMAVKAIKEKDPSFNEEEFKNFAAQTYLAIQKAWMNQDLAEMRLFASNELYNQYERQIQEYQMLNQKNYLLRTDISNVDLVDYQIEGDKEIVTIRLNASLIDYVEDSDGKVIEGSKTSLKYRKYEIKYMRTIGITTSKEKLSTTDCPNCGAPMSITASGICQYCNAAVTTGDYNWVISKYKAL